MIDEQTDINIKHLLPKCKTIETVEEIPLDDTVLMAKADGEFTVVYYDSKMCYAVNQYGRMRRDFPAINELCEVLKGNLMEAVFLSELYAEENGKPLTLPKFLSLAKGKNALPEALRIGIFDLLTTNGEPVKEEYGWKMDEVSRWLAGCKYVHVLPYIKPNKVEQMTAFWKNQVEDLGFEGVIARSDGNTYKVKPTADVDAVIIGLNKRKLFAEKKITSIKTAVMDAVGFVELTDVASGIDHDLRSSLWRLMKYRTHEDNGTVYIKPMVVCTIEYQETFIEDHKGDPVMKRRWRYGDGEYISDGERPFVSLRFPRLVHFRDDKGVNPQDLRITQIPGVLNEGIHQGT